MERDLQSAWQVSKISRVCSNALESRALTPRRYRPYPHLRVLHLVQVAMAMGLDLSVPETIQTPPYISARAEQARISKEFKREFGDSLNNIEIARVGPVICVEPSRSLTPAWLCLLMLYSPALQEQQDWIQMRLDILQLNSENPHPLPPPQPLHITLFKSYEPLGPASYETTASINSDLTLLIGDTIAFKHPG